MYFFAVRGPVIYTVKMLIMAYTVLDNGGSEYHNLCFEQKYDKKNIRMFIRKFSFFASQFFSILNRLVFVMWI